MDTRTIGSLSVSSAGLGCNNFGGRLDEAATTAVVNAALDAGITLFDTADVYGATRSEEYLGRALGSRRDEVVIATKFGMGDGTTLPNGSSAESVRTAVEGSLRRLGTDRIDLYQLHVPDDRVPLAETLGALTELVAAGKVREIGCSNFDVTHLDAAASTAAEQGSARFVSAQNELSLLRRSGEADLVAACQRHDMVILPYFPLANGVLTGKYRRGEEPPRGTRLAQVPAERRQKTLTDHTFDVVEALESYAADHGHALLELAMSWLAGVPQLASVIAGATTPGQVQANAAAVSWQLSAAERAEIESIAAPA